ncbi:MAG TPA: ATP-binding domain-containing protein [Polyangiaceae bacterium]|nr:ATP-binding domain-containing protein [Polyangiaceae bacterium]
MTRLVPRPPEDRRPSSLVDVRLDPAQREAVGRPAERALLVLGEAGHGKTTVALHRLAHLWRTSKGPMRAAVVVPTEGLARLVQPLLRRMGVDVEAVTYDRWARAQARRVFRDVSRESDLTPPLVQRVKRDAALRVGLAELAARPPGRVDDDADAPPLRSRALARRGDLQHLFGDRALLEVVARSSGAITARAIEETLEHTRLQFSLTTEREHADVIDRDRLIAVDRRGLDEGTPSGNAGRVDVEDYAVLFELDRLRAAHAGRPPRAPRAYDALLLDEAQELARLELVLLGRSLGRGGSLIVAGDMDQQTDPTTSFPGWAAAMSDLGVSEYEAVRLDIGYRCPPGITALARSVLGEREPEAHERTAPRRGVDPVSVAYDDERALVAELGGDIRMLSRRDPRASVAVVCRSPLTARRLAAALRPEVATRLVFDGHFLPRGPVQVTIVDEVKGLEFDFIVIPDATAAEYPDNPASRRALYVAITRARHQVLVAHVGPRTPLVGL